LSTCALRAPPRPYGPRHGRRPAHVQRAIGFRILTTPRGSVPPREHVGPQFLAADHTLRNPVNLVRQRDIDPAAISRTSKGLARYAKRSRHGVVTAEKVERTANRCGSTSAVQ
jgi:hypothetical protein